MSDWDEINRQDSRQVVLRCDRCGGDIRACNDDTEGDYYYELGEDIICERCLAHYCWEHRKEAQ